MKPFKDMMAEAKVIGFSKDVANASKLKAGGTSHKSNGVSIILTKHGVDQSILRSGHSEKDLETIYKRFAKATSESDWESGKKVLIYSKQYKQGVVFEFKDNNKGTNKSLIMITFLPKGKSFPKSGTEKIIVEGKEIDIFIISVD